MKKGTKVILNLSQENASKLGLQKAIVNQDAIVVGAYENDVEGHYYSFEGKSSVAIPDKYKASKEV